MNERYKDPWWLLEKYWKDKLSARRVAQRANVSHTTIYVYLKRYNICIRPQYYKTLSLASNHIQLTKEMIQWIEGELLGDGNLTSTSSLSATFRYTSKYWEYINYVANTLHKYGIGNGKIRKEKRDVFHYYSKRYIELKPLYDKWYPNRKKIVPKDLELTPLILRQWYIGDGCLVKPSKGHGKPYVLLCTDGFWVNDVEWLIEKLCKLGFKSTRRSSDNRIYISTYLTPDFLDYIGKCPVKCYRYKWDIN